MNLKLHFAIRQEEIFTILRCGECVQISNDMISPFINYLNDRKCDRC